MTEGDSETMGYQWAISGATVCSGIYWISHTLLSQTEIDPLCPVISDDSKNRI
jgi:hypothetical protein